MLIRVSFLSLFFFLFSLSAFAQQQGFDHSALDRFLKRYVNADGRVNYAAAKQDRADLDAYLDQLKTINLYSIRGNPKLEQIAFWLNVYHAALLALVLENYPLKSTKDVPGFWERQFLQVGLKTKEGQSFYSLFEIRADELMFQFHEEKVHLVLALASKDGPLFPTEVFTGPKVLGQLFKAVRREVGRKEIWDMDTASSPRKIRLSRQ